MAKKKVVDPVVQTPNSELIRDLAAAINATRPVEKKNAANRKPLTPWHPKDGSPKSVLKKKVHQHGMLIDPDFCSNEEIDLMNKLKPGLFLNGHVKVVRRKDKGLDIQYPVKTAAQRLKLVNSFGIRNLAELLARCVEEAANPTQYEATELED